jgi:tRNA (guanine-N7-)-methyltransferase
MPEKKISGRNSRISIKSIKEIDDIFKRSSSFHTLEIEIGSGNGHFITHYGEKNPAFLLIGVEIKKKRCIKIVKKIGNKNLQNIEVVQCRGEALVESLPPSSVDAFHIYFPDPWPKERHRKRRFFRNMYLDLMSKSLKPEGRIYFATDYFDYALQAKVLLSLHNDFRLITSAPPEEAFLSVFANKFKTLDRPVRYISAVKTDTTY